MTDKLNNLAERVDDDPLGDGSDFGVTGEWWGFEDARALSQEESK